MSENERLGIELYVSDIKLPSDPFAGITKAITGLNDKLSSIDWSKITKGLDSAVSKSKDMEKAAKDTQGAVENQINSIAKRMSSVLGVSAEEVKKSLKTAFQFEGVEQGLGKLSKLKDMMVEINGKAYALQAEMKKVVSGAGSDLTTLLAPGSKTEYTLFSKNKLKAEVESAKQELTKLKEFADKNLLNPGVRVSNIQSSLNTFFNNANVGNQTFTRLDELKAKIASTFTDLKLGTQFSALDQQVDKLKDKFSTLGASVQFSNLTGISSANFTNTTRGVAEMGKAVASARVELERLTKSTQLNESATKSLEAAKTAAERLGQSISEDIHRFNLMKVALDSVKTGFATLSSKSTNADPTKALNINTLLGDLTSRVAAVKPGATFNTVELQDYIVKLAQVKAAIKDYNSTSSTISNNPFKSLLAQLPPLTTSIGDVTRALGLTNSAILALKPEQLSHLKAALSPFKLTVDDTTGAIKNMGREVTGLKSVVGSMLARLVEFYSLRTILFAVGGQFREATTAALDFHQNIKDILAVSGESRESFDNVAQSIRDIAKESRYSANEIAQLMQVLAQAGVKGEALPSAARHVGMFATATKTAPKLAGDLFTTAQNNYNIDIANSARITNALTAALNESKLEATGLATAFNYLAPQTAQLGISMEKTLAMIATQAQAGVKPSTIGTGMSQMLKEFAAPKARLQNLLTYYGISKDDIDPIKNEFADIVDTLNNAMGKAGEKGVQVSHMFSALESRVGRSTVASLKLGGDAFRAMESSITGTSAALIAYEKSMEGARAQLNVSKQMFQEFVYNAIQPLAPAFYAINQSMQGWLTGLSQINPNLLATVAGLTALTVSLGALYSAVSAVATFSGAGGVLSLLFPLASNPVGWVVGGLALIAAGIVAVGYQLNKQKREQQELNKIELENIETKQKYYNVLDATQRATEKQHPELKKYAEAVALYGENSKQATDIGNKKVIMTAQQRVEINQLLAKNPQLLASISKETDLYSAQFKIMQMLNKEKYVNASNAANEYNSRIDSLRAQYAAAAKDKAKLTKIAEFNPSGTAGWDSDLSGNATAVTYKEAAARAAATVEAIKKQTNDPELVKLRDKGVGAAESGLVKVQGKNGKATTKTQTKGWAPQVVNEQGFGFMRLNEEVRVETDMPTVGSFNPSGKAGGASKETSALNYADNVINQAEKDQAAKRKKDAELILDDTKATMEARKAAWSIVKKEIQEETSKGQKAELDKLGQEFAKDFKGVKYNSETGVLSGIEAYAKASKKYNLAKAAIKYKWDQQWLTMGAEADKKLSDAERKQMEDFEKDSQKIREDEAKRTAELKKKELEDKFKISTDAKSTMEAYYAYLAAAEGKISIEYAEKRRKLLGDYLSWSPKMQEAKLPEVIASHNALNNAEADNKGKLRQETGTLLTTSTSSKVSKEEKQAGYDLANAVASLNLEKQRAGTAEQVEQIEVKIQDANIAQTKALLKTYQYAEKIADKKAKAAPLDKEAAAAATEASQQVQAINDKLKEQLLLKTKMEDTSFFGNLGEGARKAMVSFGSFKSMTEELGNTLTNTMLNGAVSSISSAVTTMFNPDQSKINELNAQIADLRSQKATLESDIAIIDANTSKTPEEIKSLNDKKIALDQVNNSLAQQEAAVRKQKDAWSSFAEGLKGIMKTILQELQNYIAKLLVVWAVKKLVGLADNSIIGDTFPSLFGYEDGGEVQKKAKGGIIKGYADGGLVNGISGGLIPMSMGTPGKDSVPIMAMPNEYVIPAHVVSQWGAGHFENYRNGTFKKMAEGGLVSGGVKNAPNSSEQTKQYNLQIVNITQNDQIPDPGQQAQQIINVISSDLARKGPTYKSVKAAVAG